LPDVEYIPHETISCTIRKRNHKWVKLKRLKRDSKAGWQGAR